MRETAFVQAHGPQGSVNEEAFDIFAEDGAPLGQAPRSQVHAEGHWHKAAHVLVFEPGGRLLVQQRAAHKDVSPNLWDLSCAEHLQAGESFAQGAIRGLHEELSIIASQSELFVVRPAHKQAHIDQAQGICDCEMVMTFGLVYAGACLADPGEVACLKWMQWVELFAAVQREASAYTPWFVAEVAWHGAGGPKSPASSLRQRI